MCPVVPYGFECGVGRLRSPVTLYEIARIRLIPSHTEDEDNLPLLAVKQFKLKTDRGAWIQTGAELSREAWLMHAGWIRKYPVAAEKLPSVSGDRSCSLVCVKESDPAGKL